ncbi:MAG: DNA recombination protein RmuC [Candidatus Omnitrophica bacterium]|nr:DNA recombination protein RmuC [Candidatus Omnitrophota bacterium]
MDMSLFQIFIGVVAGLLLAGLVFLLKSAFGRKAALDQQQMGHVAEQIKGVFAALSLEALSKNSEDFLRLAHEKFQSLSAMGEKDLIGKKELIDKSLEEMKAELFRVKELMDGLEKDRVDKFAKLSKDIERMNTETSRLQETTDHLRMALASTKAIGQWGERMAEDVLRLAGFIEGVNYAKQKAQGAARPDYTFFLPQGLKLNMDVKFPLMNYQRFFEAKADTEKEAFRMQFLRDVRQRIKEVTTRDYIDPQQQTLDYVIVFIPNEQVYSFINQNDRTILDEAMKQRVIFCSPLTLYAILAVIRQAMDMFRLEGTTRQIFTVLESFKKQYQAFCVSLEKIGERLGDAQKEYDALLTTRKNQLDRQFKKIEDLRHTDETVLLEEPRDS